AIFDRAEANEARAMAGEDVALSRAQMEFHFDALRQRPGFATIIASTPCGVARTVPGAYVRRRISHGFPDRVRVRAYPAPSAVRLQLHRRAQDGLPLPGGGHHRTRSGATRRS